MATNLCLKFNFDVAELLKSLMSFLFLWSMTDYDNSFHTCNIHWLNILIFPVQIEFTDNTLNPEAAS